MKTSKWCLVAAGLLITCSLAGAADLTKIDRTVAKEPAYKTHPKYCLLVFGPEPKNRFWLVQDGDTLYVDRNGNGDLTAPDKRAQLKNGGNQNYRNFDAGEIHDGSLTHTGLSVSQFLVSSESVGNPKEFERIKKSGPEPWTWWVRITAERSPDDSRQLPKQIKYVANGDGLGYLLFADKPQDAPNDPLQRPVDFRSSRRETTAHSRPGIDAADRRGARKGSAREHSPLSSTRTRFQMTFFPRLTSHSRRKNLATSQFKTNTHSSNVAEAIA